MLLVRTMPKNIKQCPVIINHVSCCFSPENIKELIEELVKLVEVGKQISKEQPSSLFCNMFGKSSRFHYNQLLEFEWKQ